MPKFTKAEILEKLEAAPIVPVFHHSNIEVAKAVIKACYEGGLKIFEFTNRGENSPQVFEAVLPFLRENCPDMALGIGTIYNAQQAEQFIAMGADFIVQPVTSPDVAEVCKKHNISWVPGTTTPTEIYNATLLGADFVKIFPGNLVGSSYIKALRGGPMASVKLMVTGGVEPTAESLKEWFGAGTNYVGIGSQLFKNLEDVEGIKTKIAGLMEIIKEIRK